MHRKLGTGYSVQCAMDIMRNLTDVLFSLIMVLLYSIEAEGVGLSALVSSHLV